MPVDPPGKSPSIGSIFGGVRESGMGAAHGQKSFEIFSHYKSVAYQARVNGIPLFHPPYGRAVNALLAWFIGTT